MDYILFLIGLIMLCRKNLPWLFAIIILLASTYLQLPLKPEMQLMVGPIHNVADTGLLLYLIFFAWSILKKGVFIKSPLIIPVILFGAFLTINGLYDIANGTSFGDVIRYLRQWAYLSIIFIYPNINKTDILKTIRIIFWITFWCCAILILQYFLGVTWIGYTTSYSSDGINEFTRGAKPPVYSIVCFAIAFFNILGQKKVTQILSCIIFIFPTILTLKMSYFVTFVLVVVIFNLFNKRYSFLRLLKLFFIGAFGLAILMAIFPVFTQRLNETLEQGRTISSTNQEDGNFTFRINHFSERLEYVLSDPVRSIRGMGYIQERNFHKKLFTIGLYNEDGDIVQLDTGDIAWSLLIIRLGCLGLFFYLLLYIKCLSSLYQERDSSDLNLLFYSYMLASIVFMSFGNTVIADSEFFIIPLLITLTNENRTLHIQPQYRRSRNYAY